MSNDAEAVQHLNEALLKHGAVREFVAPEPDGYDSKLVIVFQDGTKADLTACDCCDGITIHWNPAGS